MNLLGNAIKFTNHGKVIVSFQKEGMCGVLCGRKTAKTPHIPHFIEMLLSILFILDDKGYRQSRQIATVVANPNLNAHQ
jgi:signal transduction histidine kinase